MELQLVWSGVAVLVGGYIFLFGILKRVNEWWYVRPLGEKSRSLPPGDMGWPLIGNMLPFFKAYGSQNPDSFINDLISRYGKTGIYKSHMFGTPTIMVTKPETCRLVLTDDERFGMGYLQIVRRLAGRKAFYNAQPVEHKRLRKLTTSPINGHEALSMYVGYIEEAVVSALDQWSRMEKASEFLHNLRKVTFRVITHIFLGPSTSPSVVAEMEKNYHRMISGFSDLKVNLTGIGFDKCLKARQNLVDMLQREVDKRRDTKTVSKEKGTLDLVMEVQDDDGYKLGDEDITDLFVMLLLAGYESSATVTMCTLFHLHQYPDVLQKARDEQNQIIRRRPPTHKGLTLKEVRDMRYLSKVIDETMRVFSPSFVLFRQAKVDVNINGYFIPKGWRVLVWSRSVNRDPDIYSNPEKFIPLRWENQKVKAGSFLPFGGGSHICPGADLAKTQISIFLHYFLLNYKIDVVNPKSPWGNIPAPCPKDNFLARITKLNN